MLGISLRPGVIPAGRDPRLEYYARGFRSLLGGELAMALTLAICMAISYGSAASTYGVSYYGVHLDTLWILAIGFAATSILLYRAGKALDAGAPPAWLATCLKVVAIGLIALLLTPYTVDTFFNWTHMVVGASVFGLQMFVGGVIAFRVLKDRLGYFALALQFAGGILAALSLPDNMLAFMLQGEIVFQIGFGLLVNHLLATEVRRLARESRD